jgi:SAM-dependent methyltransferase
VKDKKSHYNLVENYFKKNILKKKGYYDKPLPRVYGTCTLILDEITHNNHEIKKLIDVGCGVGTFTLELEKNFPQISEIVGMDFLKEVVATAKEKARQLNKVTFVEGNILDIPFENRTFDVTVCTNLIHHIHRDDFKKAIEELARITDKYLLLEIVNKKCILDFWYTYITIPIFYKDLPVNTNSISDVNDIINAHGFKLQTARGVFPINRLCRQLILVYKRVDINEK